MLFIILGVAGLVVIGVGGLLWASGSALGGVLVGVVGAVLAAVGIIGFGVQRREDAARPARHLEDEQARDALAERERKRQEQAAQEAEAQRVEEHRAAQLRDLDRIRRAILAELGVLSELTWLGFHWGWEPEGVQERRSYRLEDGELRLSFGHDNVRSAWTWEEGSHPVAAGDTADPTNADKVDDAYKLLQPERYLVPLHLSEDDQLELPAPGYVRYGRQEP
jgi:hypothetical protein